MIEFTAWEVYAYEEGNRPNSALAEGQATERPSSKPQCQHDQSSVHDNNRIDRVVLAENLPQVSTPLNYYPPSSVLTTLLLMSPDLG